MICSPGLSHYSSRRSVKEINFSALTLHALFSSASIIIWFTTKCLKGTSKAAVTKEAMVSGIITEAKLRVRQNLKISH